MAYTKTVWENGVTPANATNMNHIEQGIYDNSNDTETNTTEIQNIKNDIEITNYTITPVNTGRVSNVQCFSILNSIVFITGVIVLPSNIQANTWLKIAEIPSEIYPNSNTQYDGIIRNADNGNSAGTTLVQITTSGEIQIKPSSTITTPDLLLSVCYKL